MPFYKLLRSMLVCYQFMGVDASTARRPHASTILALRKEVDDQALQCCICEWRVVIIKLITGCIFVESSPNGCYSGLRRGASMYLPWKRNSGLNTLPLLSTEAAHSAGLSVFTGVICRLDAPHGDTPFSWLFSDSIASRYSTPTDAASATDSV